MKFFKIFLLLFLMTACKPDIEARRMKFEKNLARMIGKTSHDVINYFGTPTKYLNSSVEKGQGTYMIYEILDTSIYVSKPDCNIRFLLNDNTAGDQKVLEYDYFGSSCFYTVYAVN